ncbi:unnamed protein product, partial [Cuscuta europaea]
MFLITHTKKEDGSFVTPKAQKVFESYEELKSKDTTAKPQDLMLKAVGGRKKGGKVSGYGSASMYYFPCTSTTQDHSEKSYEDNLWKQRMSELEKSNNLLLETNKELLQFKQTASATIDQMQRSMCMFQPSQSMFPSMFPPQNIQQASVMGLLPQHQQQTSYMNDLLKQPQLGSYMSMLMPQAPQAIHAT